MTKYDKQINILLILYIFIHVVILVVNLLDHAINYIAFLNGLSAFMVLFYWTHKQLRITQHYFELREMIVLGLEVLFFGFSLYSIFAPSPGAWLTMIQYGIFGIHFFALLLFLIFMLTFKIKKLI